MIPIISSTLLSTRVFKRFDIDAGTQSNPNGARYGWALSVEALAHDGRRFVLKDVVLPLESNLAAESLGRRVKASGEINPDLWTEIAPAHDSPAWRKEQNALRSLVPGATV